MLQKEQPSSFSDSWNPPSLDDNFEAGFAWWMSTHFFFEWIEDEDRIEPCFRMYSPSNEALEVAKTSKDFHKLELFTEDVNNAIDRNAKIAWMKNTFRLFFSEVFEIEWYHDLDLKRVGLRKQTYDTIMQFITKHGLSDYWDLIFFIISKAQIFYNEKVKFLETKEEQTRLRNIKKEANKAIEIIEKVRDPLTNFNGQDEDELLRINFIYRNSPTISIVDFHLTRQIVQSFKKDLNSQFYKNWKLQLQVTPYYFWKDLLRSRFKFRYAIALYNFFTKTGLISINEDPYPNYLIGSICDLLEFSLIKVGKPDQLRSGKIKKVRHWVEDHVLEQNASFEEVEVDLEKLYRYFDKEFVDSVSVVKDAVTVSEGFTLGMKYEVQPLRKEITHILACLKGWNPRVTQQFQKGPIMTGKGSLPSEYDTFKLLINSAKTKEALDTISFTLKGATRTYRITQPLLISLAQSALQQHYQNFKEDYEIDMLQSEIKNVDQTGSFLMKTTGSFNLPHERFLPKFINSFFCFLEKESSQLKGEYKPADRYYLLIGQALNFAGFIMSQFPEDRELKIKVQYWHSLVRKQEKN